jgi:hypothetical protein
VRTHVGDSLGLLARRPFISVGLSGSNVVRLRLVISLWEPTENSAYHSITCAPLKTTSVDLCVCGCVLCVCVREDEECLRMCVCMLEDECLCGNMYLCMYVRIRCMCACVFMHVFLCA